MQRIFVELYVVDSFVKLFFTAPNDSQPCILPVHEIAALLSEYLQQTQGNEHFYVQPFDVTYCMHHMGFTVVDNVCNASLSDFARLHSCCNPFSDEQVSRYIATNDDFMPLFNQRKRLLIEADLNAELETIVSPAGELKKVFQFKDFRFTAGFETFDISSTAAIPLIDALSFLFKTDLSTLPLKSYPTLILRAL